MKGLSHGFRSDGTFVKTLSVRLLRVNLHNLCIADFGQDSFVSDNRLHCLRW